MALTLSIQRPGRVKFLDEVLENLGDLTPANRAAVAAWRSVGRREFQETAWAAPSGAPRAWPRTKPFGDIPPPPRTLSRSGRLLRAYMGIGAGSLERIDGSRGEFGVSGSAVPYASVHRGGSGRVSAASSRQPERIPVSKKMFYFLGIVRGVWLRGVEPEVKTGSGNPRSRVRFITIPRRPHFTLNPEIRTRVTAIFSAHAAGRVIPSRLTA